MSDELHKTVHLYLVRHGETPWNQESRIQGWADIPMTSEGLAQTHAVVDLLRQMLDGRFSVMSSDLRRCAEAAGMIGNISNLVPSASRDLREVDFGDWTGRTIEGLRERPRDRAAWDLMDPVHVWGGGESFAVAHRRAEQYISECIPSGDTVVVVTHGLIIQLLLSSWICGSLRFANKFTVNNGSISVVEVRPNNDVRILALNIVPDARAHAKHR